jgi:hypothetical protein
MKSSENNAAVAQAPDGSVIIFASFHKSRIASITSSSSTGIMPNQRGGPSMYVLTNWIRTYRGLILAASKIRVRPLLRFHIFFLEKFTCTTEISV